MRKRGGRFDVWRVAAAGLAVAATVAVAVIGTREFGRPGSGMTPQSVSSSGLGTSPVGASIKVVLRVVSKSDRMATGVLLTRQGGPFADTGRTVQIDLDPETRIVMGGAADLKPGAIVEVMGRIGPERAVRARKVVILTGFVTVAKGGAS
jgi:hypothetical protein